MNINKRFFLSYRYILSRYIRESLWQCPTTTADSIILARCIMGIYEDSFRHQSRVSTKINDAENVYYYAGRILEK